MKIEKATIVIDPHGADSIMLFTSFPPPMPKMSNQNLILRFECAAGTAGEYLKANFPEVTQINTVGGNKL